MFLQGWISVLFDGLRHKNKQILLIHQKQGWIFFQLKKSGDASLGIPLR